MNPDIRAVADEVQARAAFVEALLAEIGKVIVGQRYMVERVAHRPAHRRPRAARGRARPRQDAHRARPSPTRSTRSFQPHPVHARPAARRRRSARMIYNPQHGDFTVRKGPDLRQPRPRRRDQPRARPRCSRALLEAMQERQVTIGDETFPLPDPFLVLATQNPIEQEGTYPLPEAQVDRFMLKVKVGYPTREEERAIMDRMAVAAPPRAAQAWSTPERPRRARATSSTAIYIDEQGEGLHRRTSSSRRASPRGTACPTSPASSSTAPRPRATHLPHARGARPRLPAPPRLRHARGREGDRPRRAAPPRHRSPTRPRPRRSRRRRSSDASSTGSRCRDAWQGAPVASRASGAASTRAAELMRRVRRIEIATRRAVADTLSGQYHSVFKGRGHGLLRGAPVPARRRRPHHRLERHGAHERALREGLHRGARADGDAARRRSRPRRTSARARGPRPRSPPRSPRCSPSAPSRTTTASGSSSSPTASSSSCRRARAGTHVLRVVSEILQLRPGGARAPTSARRSSSCAARCAGARCLRALRLRRGARAAGRAEALASSGRSASRRASTTSSRSRSPTGSRRSCPPPGSPGSRTRRPARSLRADLSDPRLRRRFAEAARADDERLRRLFARLDLDAVAVRADEADHVKPLLAFFRARARRLGG